ncbi:MAG: ABC transporter ATP-binding protein [bacterium]|nr:ABC transporter ATP-binding protein [bacterium]
MENTTQDYSLKSNLYYIFSHVPNQVKKLGTYLSLYTLSKTALIILNVVSTKVILEVLFRAFTPQNAFAIVLLLAVCTLVASIGETIFWNKYWPLVVHIRLLFLSLLGEKAMKLDYPATETPEFLESLEVARAASSNNKRGLAGLLLNFSAIVPAVISCMICAGIVIGITPWAIIPMFICPFVNFKFSQEYKKIQYQKEYQISEDIDRKKEIISSTFWDFKYGKEIRVFNLAELLIQRFVGLMKEQEEAVQCMEKAKFKNTAFSKIVVFTLESIAYMIVLFRITHVDISFSDFFMIIGAFDSILLLVEEILRTLSDIQKNSKEISCFRGFMDMPQKSEQKGELTLPSEFHSLEFRQVSFQYPNSDNFAVHNVSFCIEKGQHVALVGLNGSGKTTILKLIMRLYEPTEGEILLNGENIQKFTILEYYTLFSTMFQQIQTYAFSIAENIAMGTQIDSERLKNSIMHSGLYEVIQKLPKKENTQLLKLMDDTGIEFSGGQMQKLAFARAIYKNAQIVLLDEPTAALDAFSEEKMFEAINEFTEGRTSIVVTHRLSCVQNCNNIICLENGTIVEQGTHQELMSLKGKYAILFSKQAALYERGMKN